VEVCLINEDLVGLDVTTRLSLEFDWLQEEVPVPGVDIKCVTFISENLFDESSIYVYLCRNLMTYRYSKCLFLKLNQPTDPNAKDYKAKMCQSRVGWG
jgi:hypothetical protein